MTEALPAPERSSSPPAGAPRSRGWWRLVSASLLLGTGVLYFWPADPPSWIESAGNGLLPGTWPVSARNLMQAGVGLLYQFLLLFLMGSFAFSGLPGNRKTNFCNLLRFAAWLAGAAALILWKWRDSQESLVVVTGLIFAGWGFTLGAAVARGWMGLTRWALCSCVALCGAAAVALFGLTDAAPSVARPPEVSAEDRQRLRSLLQDARTTGDQPVRVAISAADLDLLAASWLSARETNVWAQFGLVDDHVESRVSVPVDIPGLGRRFLNAAASARPLVAAGSFELGIEHAIIGRVRVPERITQSVSEAISEAIRGDRQAQNALASVASVEIAGGRLEVIGKPAPPPGAVPALPAESTTDGGNLTATVRIYMDHLVGTAAELPEGDARFLGLLQAAFAFARSRSKPGAAVAENRAALVALGIQIGDPRVRHFAGFPAQEPIPRFKYPFDRKVTLHGRNDLARHFLVSAALSTLTGEDVSNAVGLLKEQLDAAKGGSGFSFADLAADLAGTRFAQRATGTNDEAWLLQDHVSQPINAADLLPPPGGLAEGLSDAEFREHYGSVDDPRFREATADIKRRLDTCPLLQDQ